MKRRAGFTMVELLVVVAVIGALTAIIVPVTASVRASGRTTAEISAARQVVAGYLLYASDHNGELMPGYAALPATDDRGQELSSPVADRYPWRLAPYLDYDLEVLYGRTGTERLQSDRGSADYTYAVSVGPAFGINGAFVGGDTQLMNPDNPRASRAFGDFCLRRLAGASNASTLIVFASACFNSGDQRIPGYFRVEPPKLTGQRWASGWQGAKAEAGAYGNVDFRHGDKALAAMLDGHVELLDFTQMSDMRRWSNQAAERNNPAFQLGQQ